MEYYCMFRRKFIAILANSLVEDQMKRRSASNHWYAKHVRTIMECREKLAKKKRRGERDPESEPERNAGEYGQFDQAIARSNCRDCETKDRIKTMHGCRHCGKPICKKHQNLLCTRCFNSL